MPVKALSFRSPAALILGLTLAGALPLPAQAEESANYVVPGNDGYGIAECMRSGSDCGRLIADSWCEAHGHAHALTYGSGEDVTGAVAGATPVLKIAAGDVVIRCGD